MAPAPSASGAPRLKLVIRRLPPTIPEQVFWKAVSEWITPESCTYKRWVQGAKVDENNLHQVFSRAYVLMASTEKLVAFAQAFDGHGFRSKDGQEYRAVVEYAPSQKVPNQRKVKVDSKQGQIDSDTAFASFMELLNAPITKPEAPSLTPYVAPQSTALLDHLRELRASKGKSTTASAPSLYTPASSKTPNPRRTDSSPLRSAFDKDSPGRTPKTAKQAQAQKERDRTMADGAARAIAQAQAQAQVLGQGQGVGSERTGRGNSRTGGREGQGGGGGGGNAKVPGQGQGLKGNSQTGTPSKASVPPPSNKPVVQIMKRDPALSANTASSSSVPTPLPARDTRLPVSIAPGNSRSPSSPAASSSGQQGQSSARQGQRPKIATGGLGGKALLSAALNATSAQSREGAASSPQRSAGSGPVNDRSGQGQSSPKASPAGGINGSEPGGAEGADGEGERKRVRTRGKKKPNQGPGAGQSAS